MAIWVSLQLVSAAVMPHAVGVVPDTTEPYEGCSNCWVRERVMSLIHRFFPATKSGLRRYGILQDGLARWFGFSKVKSSVVHKWHSAANDLITCGCVGVLRVK